MRELYSALAAAAQSDASVLIQGETGTGKELAADALVHQGPRRDGPLVVIDCGALPLQLAESELFGHEAGAYTGATGRVIGAFERANKGTVFLDEVGELHPELQPKLLGALERKSIQRVGGTARIDVDVRVIAATHRDLAREANRGTFRADLFYRLGAIEIRMPALRERAEDIPELVSHFLEQIRGAPHLSPSALERLYRREYPGNVRELLNAVERAVIGVEEAAAPALPAPTVIAPDAPFRLQKERVIAGFEHDYALKLLDACGGNVAEASRRSGLSRVNLYGLFRRARVTPEEHRR
jgi:DNA-binding NtrC family response regulator